MTLGFVYIHPELFQEKKKMFTPVHTVIFRIKINLNLGDRPENKKKEVTRKIYYFQMPCTS